MEYRLHERSLLSTGGDGVDIRPSFDGGGGGFGVFVAEGAEEIVVGLGEVAAVLREDCGTEREEAED